MTTLKSDIANQLKSLIDKSVGFRGSDSLEIDLVELGYRNNMVLWKHLKKLSNASNGDDKRLLKHASSELRGLYYENSMLKRTLVSARVLITAMDEIR